MLIDSMIITREAQGQSREALSERSVYQSDEPMYKNVIGGVGCGMSGPRIAKSSELATSVNGAVVSEEIINLSREASRDGRMAQAIAALSSAMQAGSSFEESAAGIVTGETSME